MEIRYGILIVRRWFNYGNGILSIGKWFVAFVGLASSDIKLTVILGVIYVFVCFITGWCYMKWFMSIDMDIDNKLNPFVAEVIEKLNGHA